MTSVLFVFSILLAAFVPTLWVAWYVKHLARVREEKEEGRYNNWSGQEAEQEQIKKLRSLSKRLPEQDALIEAAKVLLASEEQLAKILCEEILRTDGSRSPDFYDKLDKDGQTYQRYRVRVVVEALRILAEEGIYKEAVKMGVANPSAALTVEEVLGRPKNTPPISQKEIDRIAAEDRKTFEEVKTLVGR